jgi:hypothetical protein
MFCTRRKEAAYWWVEEERMAEIDDLCRDLKCAQGWPAMGLLFGNYKSMKIAEALALAGDRGVYLFRQCGLPSGLLGALTTVIQCAGQHL